MKNTFTSMDLVDDKFVATVYDATNNQEIYKTKPYKTQLQATQDVTSFLTTGISDKPQRTTITNTTTFSNPQPQTTPVIAPRSRCCGR